MSLLCTRHISEKMRSPRRAAQALADTDKYIFLSKAQHTLQVQAPKVNGGSDRTGREGTFLFIFGQNVRGSLTVECAIAMSLFLFAVLGMLGFFFVMRTQIQMQSALEQTGNQLAALPEAASIPAALLIFQEKVAINKVDTTAIVGGAAGVSLARSSVMGHEPVIDLVADYRMKIPFFPEGVTELTIVQRSRKRSFGESVYLTSSEKKYVYVTLHGEVYHEDLYCTYIRPKTEKVSFSEVNGRRNGDGKIYEACVFCCDEVIGTDVWITKWGEAYHQTEHCRGIWHDVEQIPIEKAWGKRACSKCSPNREEESDG